MMVIGFQQYSVLLDSFLAFVLYFLIKLCETSVINVIKRYYYKIFAFFISYKKSLRCG